MSALKDKLARSEIKYDTVNIKYQTNSDGSIKHLSINGVNLLRNLVSFSVDHENGACVTLCLRKVSINNEDER